MAFLFQASSNPGLPSDHGSVLIDSTNNQVLIEIPAELEATESSIVPTFTLNAIDAVAKVGGSTIVSGSSALDFSAPISVSLIFTAQQFTFSGDVPTNLTWSETYTIVPGSAAPGENEFITFGFYAADNHGLPGDVAADLTGAGVNGADVFVRLPDGTDTTSLTPYFTTGGGTVRVDGSLQTSGSSSQNFSDPVTYNVDGSPPTNYEVIAAAADAADVNAVVDQLASVAIGYAPGDSAGSVTQDLHFPAAVGGIPVTCDASALDSVQNDGAVSQPYFHEGIDTGTIVASLSQGGYSRTAEFTITVKTRGANIEVRYGSEHLWDGQHAGDTGGTSFGTTAEGGSASSAFVIENSGNDPLTISSIGVAHSVGTAFSITGFTSGTIASGGSENFTVTYDASSGDLSSEATVTISSNDTNVTVFDFGLSGLTAIAPPNSLTVTAVTETAATLSWTDNSSMEDEYILRYDELYYTTYDSGEQVTVSLGANSSGTTVTGLTAGRTYEFRVRAGKSLTESAGASVRTPTVPLAPTNILIGPASPNSHEELLVEYDDMSSPNHPDLLDEFFVSTTTTKPGSPLDQSAPLSQFLLTGLSEWTEYYIWIDAVTRDQSDAVVGRIESGPFFGNDFDAATAGDYITKTDLEPATAAAGDAFTAVTSGGFTVNWTDNSLANDTFTVVYGSGPYTTWENILGRGSGSVTTDAISGAVSPGVGNGLTGSYALSGLNAGTTYYVWVVPSRFGVESPAPRFFVGTVDTP